MKSKDVDLPTAADIMISRVEAFAPDTEIAAAVQTLLSRGYSCAPVVDEQGRPIGVLSEHDCVRVLASSLYEGWPTGTVADHMTKGAESVDEHSDLLSVAQIFAIHQRSPDREIGMKTHANRRSFTPYIVYDERAGQSLPV